VAGPDRATSEAVGGACCVHAAIANSDMLVRNMVFICIAFLESHSGFCRHGRPRGFSNLPKHDTIRQPHNCLRQGQDALPSFYGGERHREKADDRPGKGRFA
jgi:hypothetical protein